MKPGGRARHYLTSGGGGRGVFAAGAVASGTPEAGTPAEVGADEFLSEAATGVFIFTRFLADAATGRRSAWTGLGTNRGAESTPDVSERTEMVCGW